jgi:putative transposase
MLTVQKVCQGSCVINKSVFMTHGINIEGKKKLLDRCLAENEGAKFWLNMLTKLKKCGFNDIVITCISSLKSFPYAINAVYPQARVSRFVLYTLPAIRLM